MGKYINELFNSDKKSPIEIMIENKRMEFRNDEFKKFMLDFLDELIEQDKNRYPIGDYFSDYFDGVFGVGCDFEDIEFFIYDMLDKLIAYDNHSCHICEPILDIIGSFSVPSLDKYLDMLEPDKEYLQKYIDNIKKSIEK